MTARAGVLVLLVALGLVGSWMLGYREGEQTGAFRLVHDMEARFDRSAKIDIDEGREEGRDAGHDQVCNEIKGYKASIASDLENNTEICDFPDLDSSSNSK